MTLVEVGSLAASVATVVGTIGVFVAAVICHRQLKAMTKARQLESLMLIMEYVDDPSIRKTRYFIYKYGDELREIFDVPFSWPAREAIDKQVRALSANELGIDDIELALKALNNVGFLVRHGYAPREAIDSFLITSLLQAWNVFEPYAQRRRHGDNPLAHIYYSAHLEWVVLNICRRLDNGLRRQLRFVN